MATPAHDPAYANPAVSREIMTFPIEVDASNAIRLGTELFAVCRPDVSVVIADLSVTEFCDSSAIRCLIAAHDQARSCGVELRVVTASATVLRLLELTGAEQVLHIYPDLAEAMAGQLIAEPEIIA